LQGLFGFHLLGRSAEGSGEDGLDGYAYGEGAPAYFGYPGPDLERWIDEHLATPQVLLMGRVTYEAMSAIVRDQPVEGRDRMNELPKVVFSGTLGEPLEWNNSRLAKGDLVEEVRSLKAGTDDPLRTIGSLSVVRALMGAGLVDRLRLVVFPQILGDTGREPAFAGLPDINLELVGTDVLDGRLVMLEYRPANAI
jgi:dihydrofolate reductase